MAAAFEHGSAALDLRDEDLTRIARVDALNDEAWALRRLDHDRLLELCEQSYELACQLDSSGNQYQRGMAMALGLLAHRSSVLGEAGAARARAAQALALLDAGHPDSLLADIHVSMGWAHYFTGDYVDALHDLMIAERTAEAVGDLELQAYAMDRIANVYTSTAHAPAALEIQTLALGIYRQLDDHTGEALLLNNLAYTYVDLGQPEQALKVAREALAYAEVFGPPYLHVGVLDTLAEVHLSMGDVESALMYSNQGLELARRQQSAVDEADALLTLGRIALRRGKQGDALCHTLAALSLNEKHHRAVEQGWCHELLVDIHEALGDDTSALAHFRRFHELGRAKANEETASRIATMRMEHQIESARKDVEIHRLRSLALEREVEQRRVAQATLEAKASLDALTGLFNRGHLTVLADEFGEALATGRPVSLIVCDVDRFKSINDTFGHLAGDRALAEIANVLRESARESDTPVRYGGDEFLVMLPGMGQEQAVAMAERLRAAVSRQLLEHNGDEFSVTLSCGVATAEPRTRMALEALVESADRALYAAKHGGRDRVVAATG